MDGAVLSSLFVPKVSKMRTLILLLALSLPALAANHPWLKRIGEAAVCAAGAFDTATTFSAYSRDPGGHENSSLLANAQGKPSLWRFSLVKGAMCAGAIVLGESRVPAVYSVPLMGALALPQVVAGTENLKIKAER